LHRERSTVMLAIPIAALIIILLVLGAVVILFKSIRL
jgi:hypothetical protein